MDDDERADRILAELADDPKVQAVAADARMFSELRDQPGWQRLYSLVKAKRARWMERIARDFMQEPEHWPKPLEIQFMRGYYFGALWIISHPEMAERTLERTARRAWLMTLEGEEG